MKSPSGYRNSRLTTAREIQSVRRDGRRRQSELFTTWTARGGAEGLRVGIIVALHGQTAVARNRLKRQLRHIVQSDIVSQIVSPLDIVISARPGAYGASFDALRSELQRTLRDGHP